MSVALPIAASTRGPETFTASGGQTAFSGSYPLQETADVMVEVSTDAGVNWTTKTLNVDYTVSAVPATSFTITFLSGLTAGHQVRHKGRTVIKNTTDFSPANTLKKAGLNEKLDREVMVAQELRRDGDVALAVVATASGHAAAAAVSATAAQTAQAASEAAAAKLSGTSTTSVAIGDGPKSFTTQANKSFEVGRDVLITSNANPAVDRMAGRVTAYNSGTGALTVAVDKADGSGTHTDWTIRVSGGAGPIGATGPAAFPDRVARAMDATDSNPAVSGYTNAASIGGVTVATGNLVMRNSALNQSRNGLWRIVAAGGAARDDDFDTFDEHVGVQIAIAEGTSADTMWLCTSDAGGVLGTNAITFTQIHPQPADSITPSMLDDGTVAKQDDFRAALVTNEWDWLHNGSGQINQRAATSLADDVYGHDRWYALTQTGAIAPSSVADQEDGLPNVMRLTQSQASAQRMGYAQILTAVDTKKLRGKQVTFGGRFAHSAGAATRFAILEWTGTADAVTSDVVNDWTSGAYTAGNFFLGASLTVRQVGAVTPGTSALADFAVTATIGSTANNIIVMLWTEATAAQNVTLDFAAQLKRGTHVLPRLWRPFAIELHLCKSVCEELLLDSNSGFGIGAMFGANTVRVFVQYTRKFRVPTLLVPGAASDYHLGAIDSATQVCTSVPAMIGTPGLEKSLISFTKTAHGFTTNSFGLGGSATAAGRLFMSADL